MIFTCLQRHRKICILPRGAEAMYTRWMKNKNLKMKNRDHKKEHIQGYRDLRELLSKGMHDLLNKLY